MQVGIPRVCVCVRTCVHTYVCACVRVCVDVGGQVLHVSVCVYVWGETYIFVGV